MKFKQFLTTTLRSDIMNSDIINEFSNWDEFKKSIKNDIEEFNISSTRFPVRFIFLNSQNELKNVVNILTEHATKVELSSFLCSDNSWFTNNELIKKIKNIKESSVIVPLSEYIRFLDDINFYEILASLAEIENKNLKLYIPLVGLWERFNDTFLNKYYRKENWAPIWKFNTSSKQICIYQIDGFEFNDEIETNNLILISNTKEWFELWKKEHINKIISLPKPLSVYFSNSLPDKTFTQEIIKTPKDYLSKIFDIDLNIEYNSNENEFWEYLLKYISTKNQKNISIKNIFMKEFNIHNTTDLESTDFLNFYLSDKDTNFKNNRYKYKKWIIKNYLINSEDFKESYLAHCLRNVSKVDDIYITKEIFLEIFNLDNSEKYLEERKLLLKKLKEKEFSFPENLFEENFNKISTIKVENQLNYLTNTTTVEKEKIFEIIQSNSNIFNELTSKLQNIFPELYYYLDWNFYLKDIPTWILEYFKEYTKSKVLDCKSNKLQQLLDEKNSNSTNFYDWYYPLLDNQNIELTEDNYLIWIDALGVEWLPLLTYLLKIFLQGTVNEITYCNIRSVNLPSATEFNKITCNEKVETLDNYIHQNHYNPPRSLIEEIEVIKKIAQKISQINSSKITIYSDHGFSFLCNKKYGNYKKYDFQNYSHEGRYLTTNNNEINDSEDFFVTGSESVNHEKQKYMVTLKHTSLGNTPSHEVHGGATPEEVLVPCIIIENKKDLDRSYEINSSLSEINISLDNKLPITIYPEPVNLPIAVYNNEKLNIFKEEKKYIIELNPSIKKGKQKIIIKIDDQEVELEINIKKGGMEEEEYDFG